MTLQNIMKEIYSGLIGDYYRDKAYLLKNKETYKGNSLYKEIEPKIDELLEELEKRKAKNNNFNKIETKEEKLEKVNKLYKAALKYLEEKDYLNAEKQMKYIFDEYKEFFKFSNYLNRFSFADTIEMCIYIFFYKPKKKINLTDLDNSEYYRIYGNILKHLEKYDEAASAYELSVKWDPVNVMSFINQAELYYITDKNKFVSSINSAIKFSTRKKDIAFCYKYLADYYLENKNHQLAVCLYKMSESLLSNKSDRQIEKIEKRIDELSNIGIDSAYSPEQIVKILNKNNIEVAPSKIVIKTLKNLIKQAAENNAENIERYCTDVLKNLLN